MSIFEYDQEKHMRQEREAAWEDGHTAGVREGLERGRAAGIEEGHAAGARETAKGTAKRLSKMGMPIEKIANAVEASVEEVQEWLECSPDENHH